jgi:Thymidylate synthase
MNSPQIAAPTMGKAWARAVEYLLEQPGRQAVNLAVKIGSPHEDRRTTTLVNGLLIEVGLPSAATVANTIFPRRLAARSAGPAALVQRYRRILPRLRRNPRNRTGLYFERIVSFATGNGVIDQLSDLVAKLRQAHDAGGAMSSRYEVAVYDPSHDRRKRMGFPCLSLVSFHVHQQRLHLAAHYRNHTFVARAYGNYLALGALLSYVAQETDWIPGEMLIVSGHATIERGRRSRLERLANEIRRVERPGEE